MRRRSAESVGTRAARKGELARDIGVTRLTSDASYLARQFFERQGWSVIKEQTLTRHDVSMTNFLMEKYLME